MAVPNNPLVVRVILQYARDTRQFENVLHFWKSTAWTLAEMEVLAEDLRIWWNAAGKSPICDAVALTAILVRKLDPGNPLAFDYPISPPVPGGSVGAELPGNVTSTMSWRTGLAGRKHRGRSYLPGYVEVGVADDDRLTSAQVASIASNWSELLLSTVITIGSLVVFHVADNTVTSVISYIVENIVDSQRRRLPGRGR